MRPLAAGIVLAVTAACAQLDRSGAEALRFRSLPPSPAHERGRIEVHGTDAEPSELAVFVGEGTDEFAVVGTTGRAGATLFFEPRFPFTHGLEYTARLTHEPGPPLDHAFEFAAPLLERTTRVTHVDPSAALLPENLLKFYVHFSAPMRRGEAYQHVRLVSDHGTMSEKAFLEVEPELWDPSHTRLTLFIEPGRIKRGLALRDELGPVLEAGHEYSLEIDPGWRDARGATLVEPHVQSFMAQGMDTRSPDPARWRITPAPAESRVPVRIQLDEALDSALLEHCIHVRHGGERVAGEVRVQRHATEWSFEPERAWRAGSYELVVEAILEDLAGNSVGRPFEVFLQGEASTDSSEESVVIPFEVRPATPR